MQSLHLAPTYHPSLSKWSEMLLYTMKFFFSSIRTKDYFNSNLNLLIVDNYNALSSLQYGAYYLIRSLCISCMYFAVLFYRLIA